MSRLLLLHNGRGAVLPGPPDGSAPSAPGRRPRRTHCARCPCCVCRTGDLARHLACARRNRVARGSTTADLFTGRLRRRSCGVGRRCWASPGHAIAVGARKHRVRSASRRSLPSTQRHSRGGQHSRADHARRVHVSRAGHENRRSRRPERARADERRRPDTDHVLPLQLCRARTEAVHRARRARGARVSG